MGLRARQNGGGKVRQGGGGGRGNGNGSPGGRGNNGSSQVADTWDPANKGTNVLLSNGNLTARVSSYLQCALSTGTKTTGKLYFEFLVGTQANNLGMIGIARSNQNPNGAVAAAAATQQGSGAWAQGGSSGSAWVAGDVIGMAVDLSTMVVTAYKNNVANGTITAASLIGLPIKLVASQNNDLASQYTFTLRTTTAEFSYSPPSGYIAWGTV